MLLAEESSAVHSVIRETSALYRTKLGVPTGADLPVQTKPPQLHDGKGVDKGPAWCLEIQL